MIITMIIIIIIIIIMMMMMIIIIMIIIIIIMMMIIIINECTLMWRHSECNGISNHQPHDCLFNPIFRHRSKRHQFSASLAFLNGIHRWPVNSPHKGPVKRKVFSFDDVIIHKGRANQTIDYYLAVSLYEVFNTWPSDRWYETNEASNNISLMSLRHILNNKMILYIEESKWLKKIHKRE